MPKWLLTRTTFLSYLFEGYKKSLLSTTNIQNSKKNFFIEWKIPEEWRKFDSYQKYVEIVFCVQQEFCFKTIILSLWSSFIILTFLIIFIVEVLGPRATWTDFYVQCACNYKHLYNSLQSWKRYFRFFFIPLVSQILLSFLWNLIF